jgi:type II secretory pathway pseudopilin PulG
MKQVRLTMLNNRGFTLIELLITMTLVIMVIMITGSAFDTILKTTGRITSSEESNIEGVIGLEMFRRDLQQMGFGLPHAFSTAPHYPEATVAPANLLNDGQGVSSDGNVPRAVASLIMPNTYATGNTYNILTGTDYLAIKGTTVGRSKASQKWTFLTYTSSSDGKVPNQWLNPADNFASSNSVIVLNRTFSAVGNVTNTLVYNAGDPTIYWAGNPTDTMADTAFNPTSQSQVYYLYGVDDGSLGMPFNRADYFVARPSTSTSVPTTCAPGTGILYKANVNHANGRLTYYPLLDCVADMQVVFGWDINGSGVIDESSAYDSNSSNISVSSTIGTTAAAIKAVMESANDIRNKLRYIKVYIMAQEGRKDANFANTNILVGNTLSVVVGDPGPNPPSNVSLTRGYTAAQLSTNGWLNYRWKTYRIIVRPRNLGTN